MEEPLNIDELRNEFQRLREKLGERKWKNKVRDVDDFYLSGQGLLDMNAVRDRQANYVRTLRLVQAMRTAASSGSIGNLLPTQGLVRKTAPQSLQEKYPAAHKAKQEAEKRRVQRASTRKRK